MEIKESYLHTDTDYETIYKNKHNIVDLYAQIILLSELTGKSFEELGKLVGNYDQDINGNLDASKSVIENLSIVAENLTSVENRVNANDQRLTSVESRVTRIENDGIGNYIGTYRTRDNDDSSTLPNPAQDKDRAITEYPSGDDYKYQEWEYKVDTWTKIGVELDSHIHSQGAGITLADVANQQDPKNTPFHSVKDITHLTTQDEIYNNTEYGKLYLFKDKVGVLSCVRHNVTEARFEGVIGNTSGYMELGYIQVAKGVTTPVESTLSVLHGKDNPAPDSFTTKNYVDKLKWITITDDIRGDLGYDFRLHLLKYTGNVTDGYHIFTSSTNDTMFFYSNKPGSLYELEKTTYNFISKELTISGNIVVKSDYVIEMRLCI